MHTYSIKVLKVQVEVNQDEVVGATFSRMPTGGAAEGRGGPRGWRGVMGGLGWDTLRVAKIILANEFSIRRDKSTVVKIVNRYITGQLKSARGN